ncbi:UDP-N-acetylglucosamine-N-acetylmuramylpentapeptide N-acetylglucosamine transferase [Pseudarcicella hirudinis]|uniref:UDP-N-acetylglucosamine--N-acetylmuramyl-(pentapeptide) pyrophosphoryl-undecaprenol N-acetylglucosamine transferase n=1 Tax=Pseudarcicella hirudinis TaxID=1079859 RepID=A0A1I5UGV0_9BACT|nr:undecaprenyldiphospho-muramoylpentapeptide beta-N-acetylglucosaminyltransferase [Pseudarcicella hirudinis]SFP94505.1 UDP-N-acetylglucosamine-N-acetylmuramylpentapeptide N-acetylglucosamine transferase [Pseudarcicella hirudinis]
MRAPKVIISGGGTGGHIYPAIAIANALKEINPEIEVLFVGAEGKMEMEKVPKAGYPIIGLPIAGINRSSMLANLSFPRKLITSYTRARRIIKDFKPDVAIGVGGYASGPLLLAATMLDIPFLIQEQNSYAGVTNKFLAKNAKKICVAYPNMEAFFPQKKIKITGNPVRKDILEVRSKRNQALAHFGLQSDKKTVLVIGGSQGAKTINEAVDGGLTSLVNAGYQVVWQTGKLYIERALKTSEIFKGQVYASDFIYEMDLAYAIADVVVSRAGALSVSELCLAAKPAILVPLPTAAEDHQTKNAMSLVQNHAAILVKDQNAREELIKQTISLLQDTEKQGELSTNIYQLAKPDAAREIAEEVLKLVKNL